MPRSAMSFSRRPSPLTTHPSPWLSPSPTSRQVSKSSGASSTVLDMKTVQTFANVADTDDPLVTSYCLLALCNIASVSAARNLLLETNVLHKLATMLAHVRDSTAGWCACLVFYYFSIEPEVEVGG